MKTRNSNELDPLQIIKGIQKRNKIVLILLVIAALLQVLGVIIKHNNAPSIEKIEKDIGVENE